MSGAKVISFLERLEDVIPSLSREDARGIIQALVAVGDDLDRAHKNPPGNWFGMPIMIDRSVIRLVKLLDAAEAEDLLRGAFVAASGPSTPAHVVAHYSSEHGEYEEQPIAESEWTFSRESVERLKRGALDRIRLAAQDGSLLQSQNLAYILYRWLDWAGSEEPRAWVDSIIRESDEKLLQFLQGMAREHHTQYSDTYVAKTSLRLNPEWLEPFLKPGPILERARAHADSNIYAAQLVKEQEMLERGVNPDSPLADLD